GRSTWIILLGINLYGLVLMKRGIVKLYDKIRYYSNMLSFSGQASVQLGHWKQLFREITKKHTSLRLNGMNF
ncbi:hypothetical protein L9F63_008665, partial [Diploptera punctata]